MFCFLLLLTNILILPSFLDHYIKLWETKYIYEAVSNSPKATKELATLKVNSSINCLRFSPCGRYIVAGASDGTIYLWKNKQPSSNNFELLTSVKGHTKDVQDLAWSPDSKLIVIGGFDGLVLVLECPDLKTLKILPIHGTSHVKGVTFDPANRFFATASDDKSVKITKINQSLDGTYTFTEEASITNPFQNSPGTTYYRRCSWSPDGNHIAASNATNGPVSTVTIINRDIWDSDISLVGHDLPTEVASFCPRIFSVDKPIPGNKTAHLANLITVIATTGRDKTLAIWNTSNPRPLLVAHNTAEKSLTDVSWAYDGSKLFVSSLDGTVIVALFEEGELGYVVPMTENESQLSRYKRKISNTKDTAITLDDDDDDDEDGNDNDADIEEVKPVLKEPIVESTLPKSESIKKIDSTARNEKDGPGSKTTSDKQKISFTKEGRKRIAPLLLNSSGSVISNPTPTLLETKPDPIEFSEPSSAVPPGGVSMLGITNKRKKLELTGAYDNKRLRYDNETHYIRPVSLSFSSELARVRLGVPKIRTFFIRHGDEKDNILEIRNSGDQEQEPTTVLITCNGDLVFRDFLPKFGHLATGTGNKFWSVATEDGTIYLYSPTGRRLLPGIVVGTPLSFLESQNDFLMAITCTGLMYIWNVDTLTAVNSAVSVAPLLDNETSASEDSIVKGPCITQCGVTSKGKAIITLTNGDGFIYSEGMKTWLRVSEAWWAFGSQYWGSSHIEKARGKPKSSEKSDGGVVGLIEHRTNQETMLKAGGRAKLLQRLAKNRMLREGYENFEKCTSTSHLENRVSAAILAESSEELRTFLKMYAIRLAAEGLTKKLEELCSELLGPTVKNSKSVKKWENTLCGIDKHELLKEIILAVGKYREIQSVIVRYASIIGVLN